MITGEQLIALGIDHLIDKFMGHTLVVPTKVDFLMADRQTPRKARKALVPTQFVINVERLIIFYFLHPKAVYWVKDDDVGQRP